MKNKILNNLSRIKLSRSRPYKTYRIYPFEGLINLSILKEDTSKPKKFLISWAPEIKRFLRKPWCLR